MIDVQAPFQESHMTDLSRAISAILLADPGQRHWLKEPHPPFTATDALAVAHYGEPGAGLDLWRMCRAVEMLRVACEAQSDEVTRVADQADALARGATFVLDPEKVAAIQPTEADPVGWRLIETAPKDDRLIVARFLNGALIWVSDDTWDFDHDEWSDTTGATHWLMAVPAPLSPAQPVEAVPGVLDGGEVPAGVLGATGGAP